VERDPISMVVVRKFERFRGKKKELDERQGGGGESLRMINWNVVNREHHSIALHCDQRGNE